MGVNEDKLDMLKGIFEEQRELTDDEMEVYKDMLRRKEEIMKMPWEEDKNWNNTATTLGKENDMGVIATESRFNQTMRKGQATLIAELISRVTSLEDSMEFVLEHLSATEQTDICDECIYVKGSQWCDKCDGKPKRVI